MVPFYNMNGARVTFHHQLGTEWSMMAQLYAGVTRHTVRIPLGPATFKSDDIIGIHASVTNSIVTLEASYMRLHFDLSQLPQLPASVQGPIHNDLGQFYGLGARINYHHALAITEIGQRSVNGTMPAYRGGYITLGYNWRQWTPSVTFSTIRTTNESARSKMTALSGGVDIFDVNQYSITAGLRYDINAHMDVKASVQRIQTRAGSYGFFSGFLNSNNQIDLSTAAPDHPVYIGRVAFDLTF